MEYLKFKISVKQPSENYMTAKLQFFQNSSATIHSERVTGVELFDFVSQLFYMHCKGAVPAVI